MLKRSTRKLFKVFVAGLLVFQQVAFALPQSWKRVMGGESTTIDKAPYLVQLHVDGSFHCGGALASETTVVTAAHCVKGIHANRFVVVGGASRLTDYGIRSKVRKIVIPRNYNERTFDMDVAVMQLWTPIRGPSVQTVRFCEKPINVGDPVQLFGWGKLYEQTAFFPLQLQTAEVNVVDKNACASQYYWGGGKVTDSMFCAAAPGKDSCAGDSGSPVIVNGEYCGIVSSGIGCGLRQFSGLYTDIHKVRQFLLFVLRQLN